MAAYAISKDAFVEMIHTLDKDNDGTVTSDEYKVVWMKQFPDKSEDEFGKHWKAIDADGDGNLTVEELAKHFGYSMDGESTAEMSDEQILAALQMQALLEIEDDKKKEEKKPEPAPAAATKDKSIINVNDKKNKDVKDIDLMIKLLEACELGDLKDHKEGLDVLTLLKKEVNVRICDEKGEMPLHKLARVKVTDKNKLTLKEVFEELIKVQRVQCEAEKRPLAPDINYQSKDFKTPLFCAVAESNTLMIDQLFRLDKDGPDSLLVNAQGWTVVHAAAHTDNIETLKTLFKWLTPVRAKMLLATKDKTGREPLHIAAFKDASEECKVVEFLVKNGAKNNSKDTAGNTPSALAGRSGRRKSKELIEEQTDTLPAPSERRRSRDSKDIAAAAEAAGAPAAAPAAA